ncbi:hypothetical protein FOZ61_008996, partial [Perkinsus olseni]
MAPPKPWQVSSSSTGSTVATLTQQSAEPDQHQQQQQAHPPESALPVTDATATTTLASAASPTTGLYPSGYGLYGGGTTGLYGGGGGLYGGGSMYGGYGGGALYSGGGYGYPGGLQGMGVPGQQDLWFTQTAESLGRFNQMLEMHTMFLDQIYHHCGMIYARTADLVSWLRGVLNYVKSGKLEERNIELILDRLGQSRQTPQEELAAIRRRVRVLSGFAVLLVLWLLWKRRSRKGAAAGLRGCQRSVLSAVGRLLPVGNEPQGLGGGSLLDRRYKFYIPRRNWWPWKQKIAHQRQAISRRRKHIWPRYSDPDEQRAGDIRSDPGPSVRFKVHDMNLSLKRLWVYGRLLRKKQLQDAIDWMEALCRPSAKPVRDLLYRARTRMVDHHGYDPARLYIARIWTERGPRVMSIHQQRAGYYFRKKKLQNMMQLVVRE